MEPTNSNLPSANKVKIKDIRLTGRDIELLDLFKKMSDIDQQRVLLIAKGVIWASGPLPSS